MTGGAVAVRAGTSRGLADADARAGRSRPALGHRADIDGLRAVAVVPVLLFHAGLPGFGGGFVGVDVFFVISGYLITSIILDDLDAGRFSLLTFYERRVRRIFPALLAVLLASVVAGTVLLLPDDLKNLGQSVAAATLFASNVLFWLEAGYFDAAAERKPLLHTWSLAVEEQFYIVFPLALLLLVRARRAWVPHALAAAALLSFALSAWGVREAPSAAFYLAPARAWELLLGALLATGVVPHPRGQGTRDGLSLAGLGLVAWSVVALSPAAPFPGVAALPPCLGAAMIIHAGAGGRSLGGRLLAARPLVLTGLASYSLYLWHWPLLVLARSCVARELTAAESLGVLALALALAAASWRWIERPFRGRRPLLTRPRLFAAAGAAMGVAAALGAGLHAAGGLPGRLPPEAARLAAGAGDRAPARARCLDPPFEAPRGGRLCRIGAEGAGRPTLLLWGDSHAGMLRAAVGEIAARGGRVGLFSGLPGCPPLLGVGVEGPGRTELEGCREANDAVLALALREGTIDTVVLAAHWSLYATGVHLGRGDAAGAFGLEDRAEPGATPTNEAAFRRGLERTVAALVAAGKRVVVVGQVPEIAAPVPWTLALAAWRGRHVDIRPTRAGFEERNRIVLSALAGLGGRGLATIVDPREALCDEARCRVEAGGRPLYYDDNHLSLGGAAAVGRLVEGAL